MITRKQAEQVADTLLEPHEEKLGEKKGKRETLRSIQQRRLESPLLPAFIAAIATYLALDYTDSALFAVMLGAVFGGLFGWAARKNKAKRH